MATPVQSEKRTRRPRAVFSPSESYTQNTHYLLYFESTDSYNIALASSIHNVNGNIATLSIHGKKANATVITTGTLKMCETEQHKRTRESQEIQDDGFPDHENIDDVDPSPASQLGGVINTFPSSTSRQTTSTTHPLQHRSSHEAMNAAFSGDESDEENNNTTGVRFSYANVSSHSNNKSNTMTQKQTLSTKRTKQTSTTKKKAKRQRLYDTTNYPDDIDPTTVVADPPIDGEKSTKDILNQIENQLVVFQNGVDKSLRKMEKKLELNLSCKITQSSKVLDQYRDQTGETFPARYIYDGKNLLETTARDLPDFARKTLKLLFSDDELKNHTLPPKRDHLRRPALDQERFNILLEAIRIKFRLGSGLLLQCYNDLVKTKLSNFLYEERRRENRRRIRAREMQLLAQMNQHGQQQIFGQEIEEEEEMNH